MVLKNLYRAQKKLKELKQIDLAQQRPALVDTTKTNHTWQNID